jgi:diguanylate cyclase (GGDEF)-like protein
MERIARRRARSIVTGLAETGPGPLGAPAPPVERGSMPIDVLRPADLVRIALVAGLCLVLFLVDLSAPDAIDVAQLYAAALIPLYGIRSRVVLGLFWLLAVLLIGAGCLPLSGAELSDAMTSRILSIALVSLVAVCLDKQSGREQELLHLALVDPLTGLFNRRSFLEFCGKAEARARRGGNPFVVLMIDIDHFKRVNDRFGHPAGDRVIKALADVCARALRPSDVVARYGGEEFVINLPDTDQAQAMQVAERLREAVESATVPTGRGPISFTISIGLATCSSQTPLAAAIDRADRALYSAKRGGRNRVECANSAGGRTAAPHGRAVDAPAAEARAETVILVVDDEPDIRSLVAECLSGHGYAVRTAANATDALRVIETDPSVTLVCTDIVMPGGLDGFDLSRRAVQIRPGIKILYMSGFVPSTAQGAARGQAARVLHKPFRISHVLESVEYALQH